MIGNPICIDCKRSCIVAPLCRRCADYRELDRLRRLLADLLALAAKMDGCGLSEPAAEMRRMIKAARG